MISLTASVAVEVVLFQTKKRKKQESRIPAFRIVMRQRRGRVISIKWVGSVLAWIDIPMRQVQLKIGITIGLDRVFLKMQFKHMRPGGTS